MSSRDEDEDGRGPDRGASRPGRLSPLPLPRPRRAGDLGRRIRSPLGRAPRSRARAPRAADPGQPDAARRRTALGQVREGRAPDADGLAREGDDRRAAREVARRRRQAPRHRRGALRHRAEDRRPLHQSSLRGRRLRTRCDARRRLPRRGRDAEPEDDQGDLDADAARGRRGGAVAARGARRGLPAALRLQRSQRTAGRRGEEADAEPPKRGRRLAAAKGLRHHGRPPALDLDPRPRPA